MMIYTEFDKQGLAKAANCRERVSGYTHDFYNYPARFSPIMAREFIEYFTEPGDLILDPFMGGGTTLVEANLLGRNSIGFDISTLAEFLSSVKTNPPSSNNLKSLGRWLTVVSKNISCSSSIPRPVEWIEKGYQRNLSTPSTWPIRKTIEQYLYYLEQEKFTAGQKKFVRCVILKTGQWALDSRKEIPTAKQFKDKILSNFAKMAKGSLEFVENKSNTLTKTINAPAKEIGKFKKLFENSPKLVLTSPPYPGVHVVYHRWQIFGSKETPAPFWIANSLDGHGLTYYAMGSRSQKDLKDYFFNIKESFKSISKVCDEKTIVAQILAFSNIEWQLPKYLKTMNEAGFEEVLIESDRIWRDVPNRKWYANYNKQSSSSKEVVLFHKLIS
ncbi:DNA methyltransferase [Flagellimonas flava]|uniref:DNA methyltransferase n=1 Tax=Flagellimonas flava TaxID=570519 RepID=UPI003D64947C